MRRRGGIAVALDPGKYETARVDNVGGGSGGICARRTPADAYRFHTVTAREKPAIGRQIAEAKSLATVLSIPDDAEESAFIHAIDLARAARPARDPDAARAYAGKARAALGAFAETYPESMRAASAEAILKSLRGAE
jgi:hypothetical protein